MARAIPIGEQDFEFLRTNDCFYVDKTDFIRDWWQRRSRVTVITRPRRFGKTLMIDTVACFFSNARNDQAALFGDLAVWKDAEMRSLAGTRPVINLTFSGVKGVTFQETKRLIAVVINNVFSEFRWLKDSPKLDATEREAIAEFSPKSDDVALKNSLRTLSQALHKHFGLRPILLLDEYDTPLQEAWVDGYWGDLVTFLQPLLNFTFKANKSLERGLLTGITRVSKESIFSDLNNPDVITTLTDKYQTAFGFTEAEVFDAMEEYGLTDRALVKKWYDGFCFGTVKDIYNPWSITNYLNRREFGAYWAKSSSNALVSKLVQTGKREIKEDFEDLLSGKSVAVAVVEEIAFNDLASQRGAVWSLLLASGYLRIASKREDGKYELALTNYEIETAFEDLIQAWFYSQNNSYYDDFIAAMLSGDLQLMNELMNDISESVFSCFDASAKEPEKFYHGFVLGLLVSLRDRFVITSNRESGYGRYDVMLDPRDPKRDFAYILEFKKADGCSLDEAVKRALAQIEEKCYASMLEARGIPSERVRRYGLAFEGKRVLIGG